MSDKTGKKNLSHFYSRSNYTRAENNPVLHK